MTEFILGNVGASLNAMTTGLWTNRHACVLRSLFTSLEQQHVRYLVVRNHEGLPDENPSKDVDLLIDPNSRELARRILLDCFERAGIGRVLELEFGEVACLYGIDLDGDFSIHIDLIGGYSPKGFAPLTFEEIYAHRQRINGICALDRRFSAVFLLVYKIFGYSSPLFKLRYMKEVQDAHRECPDGFVNELGGIFGSDLSKDIASAILSGSPRQLLMLAGRMNRVLRLRSLRLSPASTLVNVPLSGFRRMYVVASKMLATHTSLAIFLDDPLEVQDVKCQIAEKLGKAFVRDGDEFIRFHCPDLADGRPTQGAMRPAEIKLRLDDLFSKARWDRISIHLMKECDLESYFVSQPDILRARQPFFQLLPRNIMRISSNSVFIYRKSIVPFSRRYLLVQTQPAQSEDHLFQISDAAVHFFVLKLTKHTGAF